MRLIVVLMRLIVGLMRFIVVLMRLIVGLKRFIVVLLRLKYQSNALRSRYFNRIKRTKGITLGTLTETRDTHASARNARTRRGHVVAAARISQRCMRTASPRRDGCAFVGFRRPSDGKHEGSRIVHPMIPDLAAAARRLAASRRTHPHIYRSDRTPGPVCACAARREGPSHADTEMALRCRPRTPATPQLGGEAAPIQIIA